MVLIIEENLFESWPIIVVDALNKWVTFSSVRNKDLHTGMYQMYTTFVITSRCCCQQVLYYHKPTHGVPFGMIIVGLKFYLMHASCALYTVWFRIGMAKCMWFNWLTQASLESFHFHKTKISEVVLNIAKWCYTCLTIR